MKKPNITAATLKIIMRFIIIIIICISAASFYLVQQSLNSFASKVKTVVSKSVNTTSSSSSTNTIKNQISQYKASSDIASGLTFSTGDFKDKITQYLNRFASLNNISVTNLNFQNTTVSPIIISNSANSLTTNSLTLTLANPVDFTNLMQFMKSIESSTPKMQITKLNIIRNSNGTINVDPITIEFYTR